MAQATAQNSISIELGRTRGVNEGIELADEAVRRLNWNAARLTEAHRQAYARATGQRTLFSLPSVVWLKVNGQPLASPPPSAPPPSPPPPTPPPPGGDEPPFVPVLKTGSRPKSWDPGRSRGRGAPLSLVFDSSGSGAFTAEYRQLLQNTFNLARPVLDVVFGEPAVGGQVRVRNFDAEIGDRDAIAGGYFLPDNGTGQPEIRFPVYQSSTSLKPEVAAVNFVHTLLLAYLGPHQYSFDAFGEGLVRAATLRVCRTPGALPATLDSELVALTLAATYDISSQYDWINQPGLGASQFIAPNLRSVPLPVGGSTGGIYLVRFMMAGTAWQKVLIERPGFIREFNTRFYQNPTAFRTRTSLIQLAQTTLDGLGSTVEGERFADWGKKQFILDTAIIPGRKLLLQPFPIVSGLGGSDFGVFGIFAHYFQTASNGNETLLAGRSNPIFWSANFSRFFTTVQDERMDFSLGFGSVAPNFPGSVSGGRIYRATVDVPLGDNLARAYLPAGAIARPGSPVNNFYGTLTGILPSTASGFQVRVSWPGGTPVTTPLTNLAFGTLISQPSFTISQLLTVEVLNSSGSPVLTRRVNKGPGSLGLDLRIDSDTRLDIIAGRPKGLSLFGFSVEPYLGSLVDILGVPENQLQATRYNPSTARYEPFPIGGVGTQGHAFFVRSGSASTLSIEGRRTPNTPLSVALKPGWNLITTPHDQILLTSQVQVVVGTAEPVPYAEAVGRYLGAEFFRFVRGANDPVTNAPEGGSWISASSFEPGNGYFVRVLGDQQITLVFIPTARGRGVEDEGQIPPEPPRPRFGWVLQLYLYRGTEFAVGKIGGLDGARDEFDPALDSELPPDQNGLRVVSVSSGKALSSDMRPYGRPHSYRLRLEGLQPGQTYNLHMMPIQRNVGDFRIVDPSTGLYTWYRGSGQFSFRAQGSTMEYELDLRSWG